MPNKNTAAAEVIERITRQINETAKLLPPGRDLELTTYIPGHYTETYSFREILALADELRAVKERLVEAESVIEHYADDGLWNCACKHGPEHIGDPCYNDIWIQTQHGYDIAEAYFDKYPKTPTNSGAV